MFSMAFYCYLFSIVYAKEDDFMCSLKWALWSCSIWLILIPVVYKTIEKNYQRGIPHTFLTQFYQVTRLGLCLCTIAIIVQLVGTWFMGDNMVQDIYYYFPTNIKIFIMTAVMAFVIVNKKNYTKKNNQ
jgi:uncharacterized membrane protein